MASLHSSGLIFGAAVAAVFALQTTSRPAEAAVSDECQFVRDQIAALPLTGGTVSVREGTFNCKAPIVINRDNVTVQGAGKGKTIFRLADQVHAPLLVIGDTRTVVRDGKIVTPIRVKKITVTDMTFDGNLANHDPGKECGETHCDGDATSIRNNAITIRGASQILVKNVEAHSSISGGLVTEKYCDHLTLENFDSHRNYFDGFAGYETEKSFINVHLHDNRGAGISIDIRFNNNKFLGGLLADNGDVGIFARDLEGNLFDGLTIANSGNFGVFLAPTEHGPHTCAQKNTFRDVKILNSKRPGFKVSGGCQGNSVIGRSMILGNVGGCIDDEGRNVVKSTAICR